MKDNRGQTYTIDIMVTPQENMVEVTRVQDRKMK